MHAFHRDAIALRQEILPVRPRRIADRRAHHAKRLGVVVGADVERIAVMREIVFHFLDARQNGLEGLIGTVGADVADLGGQRAADVDQNECPAGRFLQPQRVPLVFFVVDQRILFFAQRVAIDLVRTLGRVERGVEERPVVVGPFERVVRVGDLIRQQSARFEIHHADGVHLVAFEIDRIGQQPVVGAHREVADAKVFLAFAQDISVQQNFLRRFERSLSCGSKSRTAFLPPCACSRNTLRA